MRVQLRLPSTEKILTTAELLAHLKRLEIRVWVDGDQLRLLAPKGAISPELRGELAERKAELIALLEANPNAGAIVLVPANRILADTPRITPELLPLTALSQPEIDRVVSTVEGGVGNVQDIYPLAPLQEGIFFHHLLQSTGDAYLLYRLLAFDSFARRETFIGALQWLIDRHDILRSAVVWEQLREPMQVVWRRAVLPVETRNFDPANGPVAEQLLTHYHPRHTRLDLTRPPLLRIVLAQDNQRWLLLALSHHLVMDHWAQELMWEEIAAHLHGSAQQLRAPVPFRNFVAQARRGGTPEADEAFFRDMLGSIEDPTAPFGLLDVQEDGAVIAEAHLDLPLELARRLRTQARHLRTTPASLCHLAWALVLSRCCGQDDVVFGTVLSARLQGGDGIERAFGLVMTTLPIRITCDARPVAEVLRETQQRVLALIGHEHTSLSMAHRCSSIPAPTPLFSTLFNFRHGSATGGFGFLLEGVELLDSAERTHYPFFLSVDDMREGFGLTAQVAAPVDPARICAFTARALAVLVAALEQAPQTPLCELDILSAAERQQLLLNWNATAAATPEMRVHQQFEAQAARTPDAPALVCQDEVLSYAELNARANRLAHTLIGLGVAPDARVAIALERSPAMIVALLATLKAGGAYVPLDPNYPAERLAFMLEDCGAKILITQKSLRLRLLHTAEHTLCVDADGPSIAQRPDNNPDRPVAPDHLAYVIYTSGSTGKPKGVAVQQESLLNFLLAMQRALGLSERDSLLAVTTVSFDIFGLEIYLPLITAGRVVLATTDAAADPHALSALLLRHDITAMQATPATWRMLIDAGWSGKADLKMLVGGEALPGPLAKELLGRGSALWNLYGPTETTIWSSTYPVAVENTDHAVVPIGRPIANTQLYVLDRHKQPTPIGVPGELHIGGVGVARGYLKRPDLTAERFIPDPFSSVPGARLYKTGDLVRYRPDGNLEFLGRLDQQVKIRGFRVELGEIEAALAAHPAIREAVVVARTEASGEKRLVAYIVTSDAPRPEDAPAPHVPPTAGELRTFLRATLPDYMLPTAVVVLPALPLTPNGKVDRRALPAPEPSAPTQCVAPRTATETTLAKIWAEVLHLAEVGVEDNFFELGGHSLSAVRIITKLRSTFDVDLGPRSLFERPTIAGIAEVVDLLLLSREDRSSAATAAAREEFEV